MTPAQTTVRVLHTVLCLGLNLVIARLGLNPRWRYAVWALIALNEIRGVVVVWQTASRVL